MDLAQVYENELKERLDELNNRPKNVLNIKHLMDVNIKIRVTKIFIDIYTCIFLSEQIIVNLNNVVNLLDTLIIKFHNSKIPEFRNYYKLLKNWRQEIINSFHRVNGHVISNGGIKRTNRDIKTIIRHADSFKNFLD